VSAVWAARVAGVWKGRSSWIVDHCGRKDGQHDLDRGFPWTDEIWVCCEGVRCDTSESGFVAIDAKRCDAMRCDAILDKLKARVSIMRTNTRILTGCQSIWTM
jgi:hypothetical protein